MKKVLFAMSCVFLLIIVSVLPVAADGFTDAVMVKDINPGSGRSWPCFLTDVAGTLFFKADDGINGQELWKSDGTTGGTVMVRDINPGSGASRPEWLTDVAGILYFGANDWTNGHELWKSDGTPGGTVMVKDINPGSGWSEPYYLTDVAGTLYFAADDGTNGCELWKSDGTEAGTVMVKDINPGSGDSESWSLTVMGSTLFFQADDGTNGEELWKSDGTPGGTVMVRDINPGSGHSGPGVLIDVAGTLFFSADDGINGYELWKSDGTEASTVMVKDINPGSGASEPRKLTNVAGTLYFTADDGTNGRELWKSDGTPGGTVMVRDINPGSGSSWPVGLTNVAGTLYFTADDGTNGSELWKSDGTPGGTVMVKDINPGNGDPEEPEWLTDVAGILYFKANDGINGSELWKSDGTPGGTVMVRDINPGSGSSVPGFLTDVARTLFFAADDGIHGHELWKGEDIEELNYDLFTLEPSLGLDAKGSEQTFEIFYDGIRGLPSGYDLEVEWVFLPGVNLDTVGTLGSGADVWVTEGGKPGIGELPPTPTEPTDGNDDFVTILSYLRGDCRIKLYVNGVEVASAEQKWGELYRSVLDVDADTLAVEHEVWEDTNVCNLISEDVTATYLEVPGPQPAGSALVHWWLVEDSEENQEWIRNLMNDIAARAGDDGYVDDWTATGRYDPYNTAKDQIMTWAGLNQPSYTYWSDCQNQAFNPMGDQWIECQKVNDYYGWSTTTDNMPYQDNSIFYATLSNEDEEDVLIVTMVEYQVDYFHGENLILIQIGEKHFGEPLELIKALIYEIDTIALPKGTRTSLIAPLDVAMKRLGDANQKNDVAAVNVLGAFINKIEALLGKKIPEEVAHDLIAHAQDIIEIEVAKSVLVPKILRRSPLYDERFIRGETVRFYATVPGGDGSRLQWISDLDGFLGGGSLVITSDLSVGRHNITVSGYGSSETFPVRVFADLGELYRSPPARGEIQRILSHFTFVWLSGSGADEDWSLYDSFDFDQSSTDPSKVVIIASLDVLRHQRFSEPLPMTNGATIYDHLRTYVHTIQLRLDCGSCTGGGGWINLSRVASVWDGRTSDCKTPLTPPELYPYIYGLQLLVHEGRHSMPDDPGHTNCGQGGPASMDNRLEGGSGYAWGAMYYMWVYKYSLYDPQDIRDKAGQQAAIFLNCRFCTTPSHSDPQVQAIIDELLAVA